ncbi:MAG: hypothetical protein AB7Q29_17635 [Vicinamibacterales bacterium]
MTDTRPGDTSRPTRILAALRELVGALDRRASQTERPGELQIASDAQQLRREAVAQIEELTETVSRANTYDQSLVEAVMTDDGGPPAEG